MRSWDQQTTGSGRSWLTWILFVIGAAGLTALLTHRGSARRGPSDVVVAPGISAASLAIVGPPPGSLAELTARQPAQIEGVDIARMNLLCAEGLRGAESMNVETCLKQLEAFANHVARETRRHYYRFQERPEDFDRSEGFFRLLLMAVVLQEDAQIRYNPARVTDAGSLEPNEAFFADARDVFIHGLTSADRRMGTCASMPVLYVAVGRRLGYPLRLVGTKCHLFVRWEDARGRFNIEATARGLNRYDDEHYRRWPFVVTEEEEREFGHLRSMTAAEELATFLGLRGHCLLEMGKGEEGIAAHEAALRFAPHSRGPQLLLSEANARVQVRMPAPAAGPLPPPFNAGSARGGSGSAGVAELPGMLRPIPPDPNPIDRIRHP